MAALETEMFLNAHNGFIPLIEWIRYIDDIFAIWPHGLESIITSIVSTLQSNSTTSTRKNRYPFSTRLSTVHVLQRQIPESESELYIKPTDKTLLLH